MKTKLAMDRHGFPILLAAKPETKPVPTQHIAAPPEEMSRRSDAIREAAREFEIFSPQDLEEWLQGRTNRQLQPGEIDVFRRDVRAQQLDDLVDILDQNERGTLRTRRRVRVQSSKGYTRKTLNALDDAELKSLLQRLRARGWNDTQLENLRSKLPTKRQETITIQADKPKIEKVDEPPEPLIDFNEFAKTIAGEIKRIPINVEVPVNVEPPPPQPRMRTVIERDENNLLKGFTSEPIDGG